MKAIDFLSLMTMESLPIVNCMMIQSCNMPTALFDGFTKNKVKAGSLNPGRCYFVYLYHKPLVLDYLPAPDAILGHSDPNLEIAAWEIN